MVMKFHWIVDHQTKALSATDKTGESVLTQFTIGGITLINTNRCK